MGKRNIKLEIPDSSPDKLMHLGEAIIKKHNALGGDSPLDGAKITAMETGITGVRAKKKEAKGKHASGEKINEQMRNKLTSDPMADVAKVNQAVLMISGEKDEITPMKLAEQVYESIPHDKKEFYRVKGAGHNQTKQARTVYEKVKGFIE